jgi:OmpA-OmpF porin, OOP family
MYKRLTVGVVALFLVSCLSAFAGDDVNGIIKTRTGETLVVKTDAGNDVTVVLTEATKTVDKRGLFGLDKDQLGNTVLIPGLKVSVEGSPDDQGRVVAKEIITDGDDLEASEMIQAGLHPTAEQVAKNVDTLAAHNAKLGSHEEQLGGHEQRISANQQQSAANKQQIQQNLSSIEEHTRRFQALDDFDVKGEATVNFAVGSSNVSKQEAAKLDQLAQTAKGLSGYIVEVVGYADSTGSAAVNTKLSEDRAKQVVTWLMQQGGIPVRHIISPGAMGEYGSRAPNETKKGRAENRRVEVKVLVNKGITGA